MSDDADVLDYSAWEDADAFDDEDETPLVHQFEQRVTIDFDGEKQTGQVGFRTEATRIWHNLNRAAEWVEVHVSTGQEGLHFVAWFEDALDFEGQLRIRRQNGDDPRRTDMDRQRYEQLDGRFTDVLFHQKGDRENPKERRFSDVYDALDYIMARRDDADRMNRLANHGHKAEPSLARRARRDA